MVGLNNFTEIEAVSRRNEWRSCSRKVDELDFDDEVKRMERPPGRKIERRKKPQTMVVQMKGPFTGRTARSRHGRLLFQSSPSSKQSN